MTAQRTEIIAEIERRRFDLSIGLLRIYNYYRAFVGFALLIAFTQSLFVTRLGVLDANLFWWFCLSYTVFNLISAVVLQIIPKAWFNREYLSLGLVLADIASLSFLTFVSGGIASGFAPLILISVVTGAIIVTGRKATFIAAFATVALLYEEFYLALTVADASYDFFQVGIFGTIYFIASLSVQNLSNRLRQNDIRALTQAAELADLERLNKLIIQRMRTGIVVVDESDRVRMHNQSARALTGATSQQDLIHLPERLASALADWRLNTSKRSPPFRVRPHTPEIRANFSAVRANDPNGDITIFLEDTGEVQQQAQQLKLAELGRLSASIAHEVRNPLGAISHAAQLLDESDQLAAPDQRLTDIIINHCRRMNEVVENVLEMSRRKTPEPQRLNLESYLKEFVTQFQDGLPDAAIRVQVEPGDTEIRVDPVQFNQALTNLVENGIRYSAANDSGQRVDLVGGIDAASERPFLNVIDYGTGVDPEVVPRLFHPFTTGARNGTGLGLYISRELCETNNAQLNYYKHEDGGSVFRILFSHPDRITG